MLADVADDLDLAAHEALRTTIDRNRGWTDSVRRAPVLCHGDVHPGNVLMSGSGALLVDWDLMCVASPAWDHAMLTTYAGRWGGDPRSYAAFAEGYGRSLADDELTQTLGTLRNVAATIMRVRAGRTDPAAAEEAARRLRWWRGDPDAPAWRAQ
jgi:thiamine kinase-like enzyme